MCSVEWISAGALENEPWEQEWKFMNPLEEAMAWKISMLAKNL